MYKTCQHHKNLSQQEPVSIEMEGFHPSHLSTMLSRFRFLQYAGRLSHKKVAVKAYHEFLKGSKPRRRLKIVFV